MENAIKEPNEFTKSNKKQSINGGNTSEIHNNNFDSKMFSESYVITICFMYIYTNKLPL